MSKAKEMLLECKIKLGIKTDYKLAKVMNLHSGLISDYMAEKRTPDVYACVRIALILKKDPLDVIAEIEAESAKNPERRTFWADFLQRARKRAQAFTLALIFGLTLTGALGTCGGGFRRGGRFA